MSLKSQSSRIQHLFYRAGFGITPDELDRELGEDSSTFVDRFIRNSIKYKPIHVTPKISSAHKGARILKGVNIRYSQQLIKKWFNQLGEPEVMFREKMTFFLARTFRL